MSTNRPNLECRMYEAKYPELDQAIMIQVKSMTDSGVYVSLLEYNNIEGMILFSELSSRRIRSISSLIKVGRIEPVMVLRVDKEKGYIDLSKRRVSEENISACEERYNKSKLVHSIMRHVAETMGIDLEDLYILVGWPLYRKYGHAFEAFNLIVNDPDSVLNSLTREVKEVVPDGHEVTKVVPAISEEVKDALVKNIRRRMTPQPLKIRADIASAPKKCRSSSMVFSKLAEIVSAATTRLSAPKSSSFPYVSPGLPPLPGPLRGFSFANIGRKSNLRLSSSLQDFSRYRQLDPEEGRDIPDFEKNSANTKQANLLRRENAGSSFSKEKAQPGIVSARKKWIRVILVLLCLLLFAFLACVSQYLYFNWSQRDSKYYVVLDSGSTGTRVYVYQATINQNNDGSLPILLRSLPKGFRKRSSSPSRRAYNRMETEPGFDKLVHNISGLRGVIKPLVRWAEKQIPKHAHKSTSLFLYATAGLRRLPNSDSEWLLNNAWSILKSSSFLCKKEWVKIISGMEEAYYGWIALNHHTGVLGAMPKKETFGALDLGGSSLQVTFENTQELQDETSLKLSIGAVNHHLSAYSLAGYGLNDAFDKSVAHLLRKLPQISNADLVNGKIEIKHPCLQSGYKKQYSCSHCASVYREGGVPPIGESKLGGKGKPKVALQLVGAPKWEGCSALAKIAVNLSEWSDQSPGIDCELQPCALAGNLPRPYGKFYAISGFFVVYRFFNLTSDAALDDVLEKGRQFCEKTWDVAKQSVAPQPFIEQYCFRAPYIVSLLREGLHIKDDRVTIGSGGITWTLGVALVEAGKVVSTRLLFHSYQMLRMKINPIVLFSVLTISLVVLLCALSCVGNWTPKVFRRPYLPLFRHNSASAASVLRFQRWSPISSGDGRVKMPLSPTIAGTQQRPFDTGHGFGSSGVQLTESSIYQSSGSVAHSYSSGSLGQMQFDSSTMGSFWSPHRGQMRLQSRRSQSREDLNSSLAEAHLVKA